MTQPTEGEILKTYDTDDGSMSLSFVARCQNLANPRLKDSTYGHLLLREHDGAALSSDAYRGDVCSCNGLERIFCAKR